MDGMVYNFISKTSQVMEGPNTFMYSNFQGFLAKQSTSRGPTKLNHQGFLTICASKVPRCPCQKDKKSPWWDEKNMFSDP